MSSSSDSKPVELVVFDFDGTSMSGNSPVLLVLYLYRHGLLGKRVTLRIGLWGLRYKLRLPQNEAWVRGQVFSAFDGTNQETANKFLRRFYREKIEERFRPQADEAIAYHHEHGREVLVVSATFEPIILEAMKYHAYDQEFSTRMNIDNDGNYTRAVEGEPVEGKEKLRLVKQYANEKYGKDGWVLAYAYGDHHSDRTLLEAAQHPCAVTPDRPLRRTARREGWTILDWE